MAILSLIVAAGKNNVIGVDNELPWRLSADLQYFKRTTLGKPVIMGRKTWESLGRPLPGRRNIVVSRNENYVAEGAETVTTLDAAIAGIAKGTEEIMVIGGAQIYALALPMASRVYLTEVDAEVDGDAFFPVLPTEQWQEASREGYTADDKNEHNYQFVVYQRKP